MCYDSALIIHVFLSFMLLIYTWRTLRIRLCSSLGPCIMASMFFLLRPSLLSTCLLTLVNVQAWPSGTKKWAIPPWPWSPESYIQSVFYFHLLMTYFIVLYVHLLSVVNYHFVIVKQWLLNLYNWLVPMFRVLHLISLSLVSNIIYHLLTNLLAIMVLSH